MNALEVLRQVEAHGGHVLLDGRELRVRAPRPLPDHVMDALSAKRESVMIALGAPLDTVVSGILDDIRPQLPPGLRLLPDDKLLALVNWSIIAAWEKTVQKLGSGGR